VWGYQNNTMGYKFEDSKGGACSNLVEHVTYAGWGWDGPENEYTGLEYHAIIASRAYEEEAGEEVNAKAAVPPGVSTLQASNVGSTHAILLGDVNPEGLDTRYHFEYGPQGAEYAASTPEQDAGSGTSALPVGATVTNLEPDVPYHFRVVATNSAGTSYGGDQTFTPYSEISSGRGKWHDDRV
jgi:hypothetical protein